MPRTFKPPTYQSILDMCLDGPARIDSDNGNMPKYLQGAVDAGVVECEDLTEDAVDKIATRITDDGRALLAYYKECASSASMRGSKTAAALQMFLGHNGMAIPVGMDPGLRAMVTHGLVDCPMTVDAKLTERGKLVVRGMRVAQRAGLVLA